MELLDVLRDISQRLNTAGVPSPSVDAERLASHVLGIPRGEVLARAHRGGELDAHHLEALEASPCQIMLTTSMMMTTMMTTTTTMAADEEIRMADGEKRLKD